MPRAYNNFTPFIILKYQRNRSTIVLQKIASLSPLPRADPSSTDIVNSPSAPHFTNRPAFKIWFINSFPRAEQM